MDEDFRIGTEHISAGMLFEAMPVAAVLIDREGRHVALNQSLSSISGLSKKELLGKKVSDLSEQSGRNIVRDIHAFDEGLDVPVHEVIIDGRTFHASVKPLRNSAGFAFGEIVALTDITDIKDVERKLEEANARLLYQASHDWLTGTLNAQTYYRKAEDLLVATRQAGNIASVLFIDLDHFKIVNDVYGHDVGDQVLKGIGKHIEKIAGHDDIIGRLGGEEFSVFLSNADQQKALAVAERLRLEIKRSTPVPTDTGIRVTASIGVASLSEKRRTIVDLVHDADQAMYCSKRTGRDRVSHFAHMHQTPFCDKGRMAKEDA